MIWIVTAVIVIWLLWWVRRSLMKPYMVKRVSRLDLLKFIVLLRKKGKDGSWIAFSDESKSWYIQCQLRVIADSYHLVFDFPMASWSKQYEDAFLQQMKARGLHFVHHEIGEQTAVRDEYYEVDAGDNSTLIHELVIMMLQDVYKLPPGQLMNVEMEGFMSVDVKGYL
jgi:hypothetical protein